MKTFAGAGVAALFLLAIGQAQGEESSHAQAAATPAETADWSRFADPFRESAARVEIAVAEPEPAAEIDVVDAHWMALTMWGEARNEGELGMRAVGHVIANRWQAGMHGDYVTDTVSKAFQFSCWNANDPNRAKMLNIDALSRDGEDYRTWRIARRLADEILAGRSPDPTGGALFYHTEAVSPPWSRGVTPVTRIGDHLFFLRAA